MTQKKLFSFTLLGLTGLVAVLCATGCSSDKTYDGGANGASGKAPAASAPATTATPDASRAKPGSDDAGGK